MSNLDRIKLRLKEVTDINPTARWRFVGRDQYNETGLGSFPWSTGWHEDVDDAKAELRSAEESSHCDLVGVTLESQCTRQPKPYSQHEAIEMARMVLAQAAEIDRLRGEPRSHVPTRCSDSED